MLKLYRGLIDILIFQTRGMDEQITTHIREFNDGLSYGNNFGVKGFWNFLLEVVFILFSKTIIALGILLTVSLAVVFFPLHALCMVSLNIFNHRAEPFETEWIEPSGVKKDDGKV